jgi:N-acetylglucosamine malate deacetylase 1
VNILFVTAHPDDFESGCAGLAHRLALQGHNIVSAVMTNSRREYNGVPAKQLRQDESREAHKFLWQCTHLVTNFWEQELRKTDEAERVIIDLLEQYKPHCVVTHWPIDSNPDHRDTSNLVLGRCYQRSVNIPVLFFEVCNGKGEPQTTTFRPDFYVDIAEVIDLKRQMLWCHESQDPGNIWDGHMEMQVTRGKESGVQYAESYALAQRIVDLPPEFDGILIPSGLVHAKGIPLQVKLDLPRPNNWRRTRYQYGRKEYFQKQYDAGFQTVRHNTGPWVEDMRILCAWIFEVDEEQTQSTVVAVWKQRYMGRTMHAKTTTHNFIDQRTLNEFCQKWQLRVSPHKEKIVDILAEFSE